MRLPTPAALRDAETDFVWVIVPLSRPENVQRVIENFSRQRFPFKRLVVVLNGRARDLVPEQVGLGWATVFTSDAHQSIAKNTALAEIRKLGGGFTVVMDDDDWYGPQFLTESCGYARSYDITGKMRHFVSINDAELWLCRREQRLRTNSWLNGGTIACWAESAPQYSIMPHGEDSDFVMGAQMGGMKIFSTDVYHYLYRREDRGDHAWTISTQELRLHESERGALHLGPVDFSVVAGERAHVDGALLEPHATCATLLPPPPGVAHVTA